MKIVLWQVRNIVQMKYECRSKIEDVVILGKTQPAICEYFRLKVYVHTFKEDMKSRSGR